MLSPSKSKAKKNLRNLLKKLSTINYAASLSGSFFVSPASPTTDRAFAMLSAFNYQLSKSLKVQSKSLETQSKSLENESSRLLDFFSTELVYFSTELDFFSRLSDKNLRITLHF